MLSARDRPIAFYPTSVLFETPNYAQLLQKVGVRPLVSDVIDELVQLASAQGCSLPSDFREKTIEKMIAASDTPSTMYQDFLARRPMEIETYLGSPIKLATESGVRVPRIETLYAILHHVNTVNQSRPQQTDASHPVLAQPPPRTSSVPPHQRPPSRATSGMAAPPPGQRRRPSVGGHSRPPNGLTPPPNRLNREPSFEDNGLEEFSHLVVYDDAPAGGAPQNGSAGHSDAPAAGPSAADLAFRERELALRQRELALREQEMNMRRSGRKLPPSKSKYDDDDDDDDYFDPMDSRLNVPQIDPDNFDMLSVTSRRTRKAPSARELRKNPEMTPSRPGSSLSRFFPGGKNRASARLMQDIPSVDESLLDNPMMSYASDRYGSVDRAAMHVESRANSMTASRLHDLAGHGPYPGMRSSHSPGAPFGAGGRGMSRPSTSYDPSPGPLNGMPQGGRPSPPGNMRGPAPRHPPGQGSAAGPQQGEQDLGVSNSYPAKGSPNRSLTGSASASADSGDSGASANLDSETSAHSSQVSLGAQQPSMPVR